MALGHTGNIVRAVSAALVTAALVSATLLLTFTSSGQVAAVDVRVEPGHCNPVADLASAELSQRRSIPIYDEEHPDIHYGAAAVANRVARLMATLGKGANLTYEPGRGYLDSLLAQLEIDVSSQMLVFSRTSMQVTRIKQETPRAIFFNEDTYVGWISGSPIIEIATMDCQKGPVFYTLTNAEDAPPRPAREMNRCLACHDDADMGGGGVPTFMASSVPTTRAGEALKPEVRYEIADRTPFARRWGGWFVTGAVGRQTHLGNLIVASQAELDRTDLTRTASLKDVSGLFDATPYPTKKSDIVALLVFEHQSSAQNRLAGANFRVRALLRKELGDGRQEASWDSLSPALQEQLARQSEVAVDGLLFANAIRLTDKVAGNSGFDTWFQKQGVRDPGGRSLRDLDLKTRLFRYPVSYTIYSEAFDGLPRATREYIYRRIAEVLQGSDNSPKFANQAVTQRRAALEILKATKPEFARTLAQ